MNDNHEPKGEEIPEEVFDKLEPDSLAEATTKVLDDDALGGHATEDDIEKFNVTKKD